jgi:glyoxylate/hydroxypyruvate reductase A
VWPECGRSEDIVAAVTWSHPPGELTRFRNLGLVSSYGAGVDHLLADPGLPRDVALARFVDPRLVDDMAEYVLTAVLAWRRGWAALRDAQREGRWAPRSYPRATSVLVLGLGQLGAASARRLAAAGYATAGWSRTPRSLPGVRCVHGNDGLLDVLPAADVVVCMLPLTAATEGILDRRFFSAMKSGSYLVNVGRGRHLVEADLLAALGDGRPAGACLDVFVEEPLPPEHAFWRDPRITVTPHVASLTDPASVAEQLVADLRSVARGGDVRHPVDRVRGY